jgi:hypothetical protein
MLFYLLKNAMSVSQTRKICKRMKEIIVLCKMKLILYNAKT